MVYQTEKQLKEFDDKLPADVKDKVKGALEPLKKAVNEDRTDDLQPLMDALQVPQYPLPPPPNRNPTLGTTLGNIVILGGGDNV